MGKKLNRNSNNINVSHILANRLFITFPFSEILFFCVWLISVNIINLHFIHVVENDGFQSIYDYTVYLCHMFFVYSSVDRHVVCFHFLAIVNSDAMNIGMQMPFQNTGFIFFGHIPSSWIAWSGGNCIFIFLKNLHTVGGICPIRWNPE